MKIKNYGKLKGNRDKYMIDAFQTIMANYLQKNLNDSQVKDLLKLLDEEDQHILDELIRYYYLNKAKDHL